MGTGITKMATSSSNRVDTLDSGDGEDVDTEQIYHERQVRELCAMHALNNLLQDGSAFSQRDLDKICDQLTPTWSWLNPHRSILGTGNYDVNVIMVALKERGYDVIWFDKRRDVTCVDLEVVEGFILNTPSAYKIAGIIPLGMGRKHWYAIRKMDTNYYNLDSKLKRPERIGESESLLSYLQTQLSCKDKELLLVVEDGIVPYQTQGEKTPNSTRTHTEDPHVNSSAGRPSIINCSSEMHSDSEEISDSKRGSSQISNSYSQQTADSIT